MDYEDRRFEHHKLEEEDPVTTAAAIFQSLAHLFITGLGIFVLYSNQLLYRTDPLLFGYVLGVISCEAWLIVMTMACMTCLGMCFGRASPLHAAALCGVNFRLMIGLSFYVSAGVGLYLLAFRSERLNEQSLAVGLFVSVESLVSLYYVFWSLRTVYSVVLFLLHKAKAHIEKRPEVVFHSPLKPAQYSNLQDIEMALANMPHPLKAAVAAHTPAFVTPAQSSIMVAQSIDSGVLQSRDMREDFNGGHQQR